MTRSTRSTSVQYFGLSPEIRRRLIRTFWYRPRCSLPPEAGKLAGSLGSTASTASSRFWAAKCSSPFIPPDLRNSSVEVIFYGYLLRLDRKSTRLNSSHSSISYAVFCLKKKKKKKKKYKSI